MVFNFSKRIKIKILLFLTADIIFISLAVVLAFLLRFDGHIPVRYLDTIKGVIIFALIFCIPIFYFFKLYSFTWSYISAIELVDLVKATTLGFLFIAVSLFIFRYSYAFVSFPRSTFFISYILIIIFCGAIRFSKRIYLQLFKNEINGGDKEKTLIVGAGDAGEQILRSILISKSSPYLPIGFVDDNPEKQGETIHGYKVFGKIIDIPDVIERFRVEELIVALPSAGSQVIARAVEMGRKAKIRKIKIVPSIADIINSEVSVGNIRDVQVEDLLGREPVFLDTKSIEEFIRGKAVLITGAAGSIGSELSRQVAKFGPILLLLIDQDETGIFNISEELVDKFPRLKIKTYVANIQNEEKVDKIFERFHPHIVFHAAAYKHVPLMEEYPDEAVMNNIFGTKIIAETSIKYGVEKLIFISTDKAVNPSSVMGATKRVGEKICQAFNQINHTKFISVRFGNVLDSRGSVIPIFKEQIKKGGPVEVTHPDMKRYFMITSEACLLVMQAGTIGNGGEVFVLDMGKPIRILDLAKEMIRLSGFEYDKEIPIVFTSPRPGEKMFEEILTSEEGTVATQNQKIFKANLSQVDGDRLRVYLDRLKDAAKAENKEMIKNLLRELIPSYNPNTAVD